MTMTLRGDPNQTRTSGKESVVNKQKSVSQVTSVVSAGSTGKPVERQFTNADGSNNTDASQKDDDKKEESYASLKTSLQRLEFLVYGLGATCIVAVLAMIIVIMYNGSGTPSTTPNLDLEKIKTQLQDLEKIKTQLQELQDAKMQVEQLNSAMEKSKEVLQKYGDTQRIIHQNTFDKDAMIYVLLIIIGSLAGLGFYVCVYKPWQPKESRHGNASEAQKALSAVPDHPVLGNSVCIISFKSNRSADYGVLVGSALEVGTNPMIHVITNHADIPRLPLCKMYIMCVEFCERHVIIEEPGLALGDMKRTTYNAVNKMGGALVILYVNHRGSMRSQDLYSDEIYCVNKQLELQALETRNRFISTYDYLNDRQKNALKQAVREALKKSV